MKTWKTIVVTLGLVAMSGVAWGHGATGRGFGRDAIAPPATDGHGRIGGGEVIGIPVGGNPRLDSIDAQRRKPTTPANPGLAAFAPRFVQTVAVTALAPILPPTRITAERLTLPPFVAVPTPAKHHRPPPRGIVPE